MELAVFGTFDIGNYGDLLFPYVLKHKLGELAPDAHVQLYSYRRKTQPHWYYDVEPVGTFATRVAQTSATVIGGGHLVHFDQRMAPGYRPTDPSTPHPEGLWWLPAVYANSMGVPVVAHGLSVSSWLPRYTRPMMETFVGSLGGGGLRDEVSLAQLRTYGLGASVTLVPDSIFSVSDVVPAGVRSQRFDEWRKALSVSENYIVLQPSPALRRVLPTVRHLVEQAAKRGWSVLELPIGRDLWNRPDYYQFRGVDLIRVRNWPDPLLLTEIISHAQAAIGVSLHLSIVGTVYSVPVYRPPYGPDSKFVLLDGIPSVRPVLGEERIDLVGKVDAAFDNECWLRPRQRALDAHWQSLADGARSRASGRASLPAWQGLALRARHARSTRGVLDRVDEARNIGVRLRHATGRRLFSRLS